jgi:hypothetical protein
MYRENFRPKKVYLAIISMDHKHSHRNAQKQTVQLRSQDHMVKTVSYVLQPLPNPMSTNGSAFTIVLKLHLDACPHTLQLHLYVMFDLIQVAASLSTADLDLLQPR